MIFYAKQTFVASVTVEVVGAHTLDSSARNFPSIGVDIIYLRFNPAYGFHSDFKNSGDRRISGPSDFDPAWPRHQLRLRLLRSIVEFQVQVPPLAQNFFEFKNRLECQKTS